MDPNANRKRDRPEDDSQAAGPSPAPNRPSPSEVAIFWAQQQQQQQQKGKSDGAITNLVHPSQARPNMLPRSAVQANMAALGQGQGGPMPHELALQHVLPSQQSVPPHANAYSVAMMRNLLLPPGLAAAPAGLQPGLAAAPAGLQPGLSAVPSSGLNPLQALQVRLLFGGSLFEPGGHALGQPQTLPPSQQQQQQPTYPPGYQASSAAAALPLGQPQPGNAFPVSNVFSAAVASSHPGSSMLVDNRASMAIPPAVQPESNRIESSAAMQLLAPDRDMKLLYTPADDTKLSPYQCLARKQIELYEASEKELEAGAQGRNRPIVLGQVGIRCRWCASLPSRQRHRASAYYPSQLSGIYQAAQNITNSHLSRLCQNVPQDIRQELVRLQAKKSGAGGGKKYWSQSAWDQGVRDAGGEGGGLRFVQPSRVSSSVDEEPETNPTTETPQEGKEPAT